MITFYDVSIIRQTDKILQYSKHI